ncbi:NADPH:quinone reductase, partial [Cladochytrium tenue]
MRAVQYTAQGGVDVIAVRDDVARPQVAAGSLLVRNHFAGVNFIDTYHRSGLYKVPLPFIP